MNTQKVTVSLPKYLYEELRLMIRPGDFSSFMTEAAEEKMLDEKMTKSDPVEDFIALRKIAPKFTDKQIFAAIRKGRM